MQDLLFALHLLGQAVGTCPILERSDVLTRRGFVQLEPADAIVLSLGSELALHFRHRRTGWMIAIHGFRLESLHRPEAPGLANGVTSSR
jgi:hypothetical protein